MFCKKGTVEKKQLLEGVHLRTLVYGEKTLMGQFSIAKGSAIPPHSHPHEQVTYIVEGEVLFFLGEEKQRLNPGDMVAIPANLPHSIQLVSAHVRLIDSFTPLRQEFL